MTTINLDLDTRKLHILFQKLKVQYTYINRIITLCANLTL